MVFQNQASIDIAAISSIDINFLLNLGTELLQSHEKTHS